MEKLNPTEGNFFAIPRDLPKNFELFQPVLTNENISIERIISTGQKTPDDQWLEQDKNEWVMLLQGHAEILFDGGEKHIILPGHYIFIPGNTRHKITMTSSDPPCIWVAVHY